MTETAVPPIKDELERKTFETLDWLITSVAGGRMTEEQFSVGIDAVFKSVSGLVGKNFIELITASQEMIRNDVHNTHIERFYLIRGNELVVVKWVVGTDKVRVTKWKNGKMVGTSVVTRDDPAEARVFMMGAVKRIEKEGFSEV